MKACQSEWVTTEVQMPAQIINVNITLCINYKKIISFYHLNHISPLIDFFSISNTFGSGIWMCFNMYWFMCMNHSFSQFSPALQSIYTVSNTEALDHFRKSPLLLWSWKVWPHVVDGELKYIHCNQLRSHVSRISLSQPYADAANRTVQADF